MKRLVVLLSVFALALTACEPEPVLTLSKDSIEFTEAGGTQVIRIVSNYPWTATPSSNEVTVSPTSGVEGMDVSITLPANNGDINREFEVTFQCESKKISLRRSLLVVQLCPMGHIEWKATINPYDEATKTMSAEGAEITFDLTANAAWTLKCEESDVTLDKTSGAAGTFEVKATVPACPVFEGRTVTFTLDCNTFRGGKTQEIRFKQAGGVIVYGGEVYHAVKMQDGKWWMKENLRYVPEGMTPSFNLSNVTAGVYYPVVLNDDHSDLEFSRDAEVIKANGYLYQAEVALGLKVGDLTSVEAAEALNGVRGICPEGWHVPISTDIMNLVGKAVSPLETNPEAPYYDKAMGNGSIVKLNADGFNMDAVGFVSIQDNTKPSGKLMGWNKSYPDKITSSMFCGSTCAGVTYNTKDEPSSGVKNLQFYGFMPMTNKATEEEYTCNGTKVSYRIAGPLRCVKDN